MLYKIPLSVYSGFTKLHMGLVVLVKKMSVFINFLLQNTNLVSVLLQNLPTFCRSCLIHFVNSVYLEEECFIFCVFRINYGIF